MAKIERIYIYHSIALVIGLLLAIISIRYLLLNDLYLIPEHRDVKFYPYLMNTFNHYFYTWSEFGSHAFFEGIARVWFCLLLFFSPSMAVFSRLMFLFYYLAIFFIPYISFFYLLKNFLKYDGKVSFLTALVVAFVYSLNPYTIQVYSPPYTYTLSYALLPALVTSLILALESDKFSSKMLLTIVITLMVTPIVRYIVHTFILTVVITLLYFIYARKERKFYFKNVAKKYILITIVLLFINLYWIAPSLIASRSKTLQPSYIVSYEMTEMFSTSYTMKDIFALSASWWPYLPLRSPSFLIGNTWILFLYFITISSIASLLLWNSFGKKEKFLALSGGFVYLVGLCLWKGVDNPIPYLSNLYSFFLFSIHPSIGWMFRVPGCFGTLVVPAMVLLLSLLIAKIIHKIYVSRKIRIKYFYTSLIVGIVLISGTVSWQRFTGNLDGILEKGYYTEDFVGKLDNAKFIILLTNYKGTFKPHRTGEPYFNLPNDLDRYLKNVGDEQLIAYVMQIVNAKNLVTDIEFSENYLEKSPIIIQDLNVFHLKGLEPYQIKSVKYLIFFDGNWQYLGSLSKIENSCEYGLTTEVFDVSSMIFDPKKYVFLILLNNKKVLLLTPFDYTVHHNPSSVWSKAMTSDPLHGEWHIYLERMEIENWDSDYGKGLVFTWAPSRLKENLSPNINDLVIAWDFSRLDDLYQWREHTPKSQFGAVCFISLENGALKAELWNSTWGWKTINSPLIPSEYGNWYRWELQIKGKNASGVHVKIAEYDKDKKLLTTKYVKHVGSGSFDWKTIVIDYTPENSETRYIQLQIWHGHETTQPLPNIIWVDNVKVYDLRRFVEPVFLKIPFKLKKTDEYVFFIRLFKNQRGGMIKIQLDDKTYILNTEDQLNKFVWQYVDTLTLEKGSHKIILTNLKGFNAVNLFVLIPKHEYQKAQAQLEKFLQDKRVIYIFEAESDLYHQNANVSKYGVEASNGRVLVLYPTSKAYRTIEILKTGNYVLAIRGEGNLTVKIDGKEYEVSLPQLNWTYIGPIYLEKGKHTIEITSSTQSNLDVIWLYSTQKGNETLEDIFASGEKPAEIIGYQKVNPTKYVVEVNASKPFMLAFAESYDPLWVAYVNGQKVRSVPLYGVINGFWINQTGPLKITIEYEPQKWFYYGSIISITTLIACITYIVYDWARDKSRRETAPQTGRPRKTATRRAEG
ncbi:MAG: hypothetical protein ACTSVW_04890 [Candidatus Njordarchaeales archaeon]